MKVIFYTFISPRKKHSDWIVTTLELCHVRLGQSCVPSTCPACPACCPSVKGVLSCCGGVLWRVPCRNAAYEMLMGRRVCPSCQHLRSPLDKLQNPHPLSARPERSNAVYVLKFQLTCVHLRYWRRFRGSGFQQKWMWNDCGLSITLLVWLFWLLKSLTEPTPFFSSSFPLLFNICLSFLLFRAVASWPPPFQNGSLHPWPGFWGNSQKANSQTARSQPEVRGHGCVGAQRARREVCHQGNPGIHRQDRREIKFIPPSLFPVKS